MTATCRRQACGFFSHPAASRTEHPRGAGRTAGQADRRLQRPVHSLGAVRPSHVHARHAWEFIAGQDPSSSMTNLGWKSVGVLELTALPSIDKERWVPWVREADVLLVDGGDATYLCHWMRESGLADLLPSLPETVWVGVSAGSMVMTPRIGDYFVEWTPANGDDRTLGVVDFSIFPHLGHEFMPGNTIAAAQGGPPISRVRRTPSTTRRPLR